MSRKSSKRGLIPLPVVGLNSGYDSSQLRRAIAELSIGEKMNLVDVLSQMAREVSASAQVSMNRIATYQPSN